jgi:hypothetical protein
MPQWADLSRVCRQPNMAARLVAALDLYPCDLLFVHRDAEGQPPDWRREEISRALVSNTLISHVPVVPARMTEAWLLIDEQSIRLAAGNPNGAEDLDLPEIQTLEEIHNPKDLLRTALLKASGLNVRRRSQFRIQERVHRVAEYIDDFSPLKALPAFQMLQSDISAVIARRNNGPV